MTLYFLCASPLFAQCDTIPVAKFIPFYFNLGGGGLRWLDGFESRATIDGNQLDTPITVGGEILEIHVGMDGEPLIYFNGEGLYAPDGQALAGGQKFGDYTRFGQRSGSSYANPVFVPDPDLDILHIFYGAIATPTQINIDFDLFTRPAWYARYHIGADTLQVIDSVLHMNSAEGWVGLRAVDEQSWWVINRVFNPARTIAYKLLNGRFIEKVESPLPRHLLHRSTHFHGTSLPTGSRDGNQLAWHTSFFDSLRYSPGGGGGGMALGSFEVAHFDCSTGEVSDYRLVDTMSKSGGLTSLSPSGRYLYYQHSPSPFAVDTLYRFDLWETGAIREMVADSIGETAWRGPDDRIYTVIGRRGMRNGYIDYPDRWTQTPDRPTGMKHVVYPNPSDHESTSFLLHRPLIDLQDLRRPTVRGPNLISCTDTASFTINENCFYNAAGILLSPGPGIELIDRTGPDFQLAFDPDSTLSPIRYVALANEHPCRTYRDTVWMFVENCDGGCQPQEITETFTVCDSSLVHDLWRDTSGTYAQTFMSFGGCDSTSIVELTINTSVETAEAINACDSVQIEDVWITEDGDYPTIYATSAGCDSTHVVSVSLQTTPLQLQLPTDTTIATLALLEINADSLAQFAFQWTPPSAVDCEDCPNVEVVAGFAGRLQVDIGEEPCISSQEINITREDLLVEVFSAPTAFSPNGDGNNDFFEIAVPTGAELLSFEIYNRWGTQVYASSCPCSPNRFGLIQTWDGNERGTPVNPGGFAYIGQIRYADGREELVEGSLLVVR